MVPVPFDGEPMRQVTELLQKFGEPDSGGRFLIRYDSMISTAAPWVDGATLEGVVE